MNQMLALLGLPALVLTLTLTPPTAVAAAPDTVTVSGNEYEDADTTGAPTEGVTSEEEIAVTFPCLGPAAAVLCSDAKLTVTSYPGVKYTFSDSDFKCAMGVRDFTSVTIESLPDAKCGTLLYKGEKASVGLKILRKDISGLCLVPKSTFVEECNFTFTSEGQLGGAEMGCTVRFCTKENHAPKLSQTVSTAAMSGTSAYGSLGVTDEDGDAVSVFLLSGPKYGTVALNPERAEYCYEPLTDKRVSDAFTVVAVDAYGAYSDPTVISVSVTARPIDCSFVDMSGHRAESAALTAVSAGVLTYETVGDDAYFYPEKTMTRAEFVGAALKAAKIAPSAKGSATFFDDNADIPTSLVGYVDAAARRGIVSGDFDGRRLAFRPNDPITKTEAAAILSSLLPAKTVSASADTSLPVWAREPMQRCIEAGAFGAASDGDMPLPRSECAVALAALLRTK